jgi:hypothetical protein
MNRAIKNQKNPYKLQCEVLVVNLYAPGTDEFEIESDF